jgi:hypothetical protein
MKLSPVPCDKDLTTTSESQWLDSKPQTEIVAIEAQWSNPVNTIHFDNNLFPERSLDRATMSTMAESTPSRLIEEMGCRVTCTATQRFQRSHYFEINRIECELRDGQLCLHGRVSSYFMKQLAQELVRSIDGVCSIQNHIEVVPANAFLSARSGWSTKESEMTEVFFPDLSTALGTLPVGRTLNGGTIVDNNESKTSVRR